MKTRRLLKNLTKLSAPKHIWRQGSGFKVQGLGFGFRVQGSRVEDLRLRAQGSEFGYRVLV